MSLLWFKVAFVLDADMYHHVTFNVFQQKLKSFQTKGKLKVYKKCENETEDDNKNHFQMET